MKHQKSNHSFFVIRKTLGLVEVLRRVTSFQTGPSLYLIDCKEENINHGL